MMINVVGCKKMLLKLLNCNYSHMHDITFQVIIHVICCYMLKFVLKPSHYSKQQLKCLWDGEKNMKIFCNDLFCTMASITIHIKMSFHMKSHFYSSVRSENFLRIVQTQVTFRYSKLKLHFAKYSVASVTFSKCSVASVTFSKCSVA